MPVDCSRVPAGHWAAYSTRPSLPTHFNNCPCAAVPKAGSVAPKEQSLAERDADFRKRQKEKQEADAKEARASAETAQRQRACEDARAYLKNLQSGNRAVKVDPKTGERVFLEDAQYASEIAAAQKIADANCK